jgi:hypothetical protein
MQVCGIVMSRQVAEAWWAWNVRCWPSRAHLSVVVYHCQLGVEVRRAAKRSIAQLLEHETRKQLRCAAGSLVALPGSLPGCLAVLAGASVPASSIIP